MGCGTQTTSVTSVFVSIRNFHQKIGHNSILITEFTKSKHKKSENVLKILRNQ